jgi:hypothetical protein
LIYVLIAGAIAFAIALSDERKGLIAMLVVGFAQDPIRKMLPGEPLYLTVAAAGIAGVVFLGLISRQPVSLQPIAERYPRLRTPLIAACVLIVIQAAHAYFNTRSIMVPAVGFIAYFAPLGMLVLAVFATERLEQVYTFLLAYVVLAAIPLAGVYFSYLGSDHPLLQSVGEGLYAYSPETESGKLTLHQGFFRGSELAGWHAAAAACFCVALVMRDRTDPALRLTLTILIPLLLVACFFTGRRKFLVLFGLFLVFTSLYGLRKHVFAQIFSIVAGAVAAAFGFMTLAADGDKMQGASPYLTRLEQLTEEAPDRVTGVGFTSLKWVFLKNGVLGSGAGAGSQGAQNYGGGSNVTGAAAEGGLAKVLAELGVVGLVIVGVLLLALVRSLWESHENLNDEKRIEHAELFVVISAFLTANFITFIIAHQIFGDPFVLVILGLAAGALLAIPGLAGEEEEVGSFQ